MTILNATALIVAIAIAIAVWVIGTELIKELLWKLIFKHKDKPIPLTISWLLAGAIYYVLHKSGLYQVNITSISMLIIITFATNGVYKKDYLKFKQGVLSVAKWITEIMSKKE